MEDFLYLTPAQLGEKLRESDEAIYEFVRSRSQNLTSDGVAGLKAEFEQVVANLPYNLSITDRASLLHVFDKAMTEILDGGRLEKPGGPGLLPKAP